MKFNIPSEHAITGTRLCSFEYLSGSLASSLTYFLFSPLEVVKTRLQLQDMPGWKQVHSKGFMQALKDGMSKEGLLLFLESWADCRHSSRLPLLWNAHRNVPNSAEHDCSLSF